MENNYLLEKMLNLPEFEITDLKHNDDDIVIYAKVRNKPDTCPSCGVIEPSLIVRQHNHQMVRDISMQGKRVGLKIDRIKYQCKDCKHLFYEPLSNVLERSRMTTRLRNHIAEKAKEHNFTSISKEFDISIVTIRKIFLEEIDKLPSYSQFETPSFSVWT